MMTSSGAVCPLRTPVAFDFLPFFFIGPDGFGSINGY
jgi:hypothetical protein